MFSLSVFFKPSASSRKRAKEALRLSDSVSGRVCGPSAFTCARACTFYNSVFIGDLDEMMICKRRQKSRKKFQTKKHESDTKREKKRRKKNTRERNKKKSNEVGLYLIKNTSSLSLSCVTRNDARRARPPRTKKTR